MKRGSGLYVPLWSKMEDNNEHDARQPREQSSREKTEWGFRLYFPLRKGSRRRKMGEGEGYWEREERRGVQSYLNGAGSACGEGNTQGRELCFLSLWERPNALTNSFVCVGHMWFYKCAIYAKLKWGKKWKSESVWWFHLSFLPFCSRERLWSDDTLYDLVCF